MPWDLFRRLNYRQLLGLLGMFIKNPVYAIPTVIASNKCMAISQKEYGSKHHLSNPANAFRHALWVILIAKKCMIWKNDEERAMAWAKKFTDWHEDFSPNKALERAMDLHNNQMGAIYFEAVKYKKKVEIITFLRQKASEAQKISAVEDTKKYPNKLVYIAE